MFATQPRLFNPIEDYDRSDEVIFAGSWYKQHPSRCEEMESVFDVILESPHTLKIYDRHSENDDPNHTFPEKYHQYIHPRLTHDNLSAAYKGSKYALNFNTVTESPTMFARRVFELMSSNTLVVSNYSVGLTKMFGESIVFADGTVPLNLSEANTKREKCLYDVLFHHTYQHRFEQILRDIDMPYAEHVHMVTCCYHVADMKQAQSSIKHFYSLDWENKKCVLNIERDSPPDVLQDIACKYNACAVEVYSQHYNEAYADTKPAYATSGYLINATTELEYGFIKKALAHSSYLTRKTAFISGDDKYTLREVNQGHNMLMPIEVVSHEVLTAYVI